jgi:hypothetical protein
VSLEIVPVTFREAKAFIARHHRHHRPPRGMNRNADMSMVGLEIERHRAETCAATEKGAA